MKSKFLAPLQGIWSQANARERRLILAAAVVVGLAVLYVYAESVFVQSSRLSRELPAARAALARMQAEAGELDKLRQAKTSSGTVQDPAKALESLTAAAHSRGLELNFVVNGEGIAANGEGPFPTVIDWLASVQAEQFLRPTRLSLESKGERVRLDVQLQTVQP